jgi:hypothetical protein
MEKFHADLEKKYNNLKVRYCLLSLLLVQCHSLEVPSVYMILPTPVLSLISLFVSFVTLISGYHNFVLSSNSLCLFGITFCYSQKRKLIQQVDWNSESDKKAFELGIFFSFIWNVSSY